ncbi:hypothetical protein Tco_0991650 [Tanacetum coccineum]|uniref:Uncharacterized protein n=1 Tax=Tanacetum coccineum TaxID=301880 RepID=A0ABQ5EZV6_9ASTR
MANPILNEARANQYLATESNVKFELSNELLTKLQSNTYSGLVEEDVIGHITKVLEILDLVEIAKVGNEEGLMDDVSSDEEWEEHEYGTLPNPAAKPNLDTHYKGDESNHEKQNENGNELGKFPYQNNESNKGKMCKTEMFEVVKYSLGPNEDFVAIKNRRYKTWKKSKDSLSHIYQIFFRKQGEE